MCHDMLYSLFCPCKILTLQQAVTTLDFHPTVSILASGSKDCTIKFFDYSKPSAKRAYRVLQEVAPVRCLYFHPSGEYVLVGTNQSTRKLKYIYVHQMCLCKNIHVSLSNLACKIPKTRSFLGVLAFINSKDNIGIGHKIYLHGSSTDLVLMVFDSKCGWPVRYETPVWEYLLVVYLKELGDQLYLGLFPRSCSLVVNTPTLSPILTSIPGRSSQPLTTFGLSYFQKKRTMHEEKWLLMNEICANIKLGHLKEYI